MKKQKIYLILCLLSAAGITLNAESKRNTFPANGSLEKKGNEVQLSYTLTVEREAVSSCRTVYLIPQLAGKSDVLTFPPVIIKGKARNRAFERWAALHGKKLIAEVHAEVTVDSRTNKEIDYSTILAYEPWMDEAELRFEERVFYCGKEETKTYSHLAALETIMTTPADYTSQPQTVAPLPVVTTAPVEKVYTAEKVYTKEKEVETTPYREKEVAIIPHKEMDLPKDYQEKEGIAYIAFEQGKSLIRPMYCNNKEELADIARIIRSIEENETAKIVGLILTGYASPEGNEMKNYKLAKKRAEEVMEYINEEFDLWLPKKRMKTYSRGEDWEGLRALLEENYIPYRREVLSIINSDINSDEKERRLRQVGRGEVYRILLEDFFPKLRKTKYQILYKVKE